MALSHTRPFFGTLEAAIIVSDTCKVNGVLANARLPIPMARPYVTPLQQSFSNTHSSLSIRQPRAALINSIASEEELALDEGMESLTSEHEEMSPLTPTPFEVQSLLMQVCDETSIAEVQLKVGAFSMRVKREVGKVAAPVTPVASPPPVPSKPMLESIPAASVPPAPKRTSISAAIVKPVSNFGLLDAAADAGLLFVTSPKVGLFRKGRVVKGKSSPPLCEEGQVINKGQVVCYLEQLGTQQPVEADISGEVEKVLWEDGEPVGFGDPLIAIRPSFQGIKVQKF